MLSESINSILNQDYSDIELLIIDDGSENYSNYKFVVNNYKDKRVHPIKNAENMGVAKTLNKALNIAKGSIICRMDADDIATPNRISTLVHFLEDNPSVSVVGSFATTFGAAKATLKYPLNDVGIRIELLYNNPFCHPTVAFKKSILDKHSIQYPTNVAKEDYNMWVSLSQFDDVVFANIPRVLLNYRVHSNQVTQKDQNKLKAGASAVTKKALGFFGVAVDNESKIENYVKTNYNSAAVSVMEFSDAIDVYNQIYYCACSKSEEYKKQATDLLSIKIKKIYIKQIFVFHSSLNGKNIPDWVCTNTGNTKLDVIFLLAKLFTFFA